MISSLPKGWASRRNPSRTHGHLQLEALEERCVPSLAQVTATGGDPYNGVVSIVVTYNDIPNTQFSGSGAFIDADHVLTAAHVLWNPDSKDNGGFPDHLYVYAGRNGGDVSYDGQVYGDPKQWICTIPQAFEDAANLYGSVRQAFGCSDIGVITLSSWPAHYNFGVTDLPLYRLCEKRFSGDQVALRIKVLGFPVDTSCSNPARSSAVNVTRYLSMATPPLLAFSWLRYFQVTGSPFTCQSKIDGTLACPTTAPRPRAASTRCSPGCGGNSRSVIRC